MKKDGTYLTKKQILKKKEAEARRAKLIAMGINIDEIENEE
jgi:hypothetical protein